MSTSELPEAQDTRFCWTDHATRGVKIWDLDTGTLQFELDAHADTINSIYITPDSRTLTTVSTDRTIKQWRAASNDEVHQMRQRWQEITRAQESARSDE